MVYEQHHAWYVFPVWGHITSANALIIKMLEENPALVVTYVTHSLVDTRRFPEFPKDRFRLLTFGDPDISKNVGKNTIAEGIAQLSKCWIETLQEACDGAQAWPKPTALMLDQNGSLHTLPQVRNIVGPDCKAYMYWAGSAARLYSFLAPSGKGGFSDWEDIADKYVSDETLRKGRERSEIIDKVCIAKNGFDEFNGTVISIPGIQDMYDYEREFGEVPLQAGVSSMLRETVSLAKATDGVVCASSMALEGETIAACQTYTTVYPVGVQVAPRGWSKNELVVKDETLRAFLDSHRKGEVVLISFGSLVFPTNKANFQALVSALIEAKYPFVLVLGGMFAGKAIAPSEISRINDSGVGYVCDRWVDQQSLLQHPSIGWLFAHGGFNSTVESLVQGIPLIGWPLAPGDNAINTAVVSTRQNPVAFEVMQIRTGSAKGKPRRGGSDIVGTPQSVGEEFRDILKKMRGKEGSERRANAQTLAEELKIERDTIAKEIVSKLATT
ncbi:UDP-glycosyltransferase 76D1 [Colletotrichum siamense]|nr:UDP-glycosyltransferase 76D1 [Colletotrichum siamense]